MRKNHKELFVEGNYIPCEVSGEHRMSLVAFVRALEEKAVLVAVPRMTTRLVKEGQMPLGDNVWNDTAVLLPAPYRDREWKNPVTGETVSAGKSPLNAGRLLKEIPVAVCLS
jgi:(1->4)-alpha-D-glucan 1-alpha-D-glucosylmutase